MTYLYLELVIGALTVNALYSEHINREKWAMYELQSAKLQNLFDMLLDSIVAALKIMNSEAPTRAVGEVDEQGHIVESRPHPETSVSLVIKKTVAVLAVRKL